jgi:ribosomal protein S18 acetylase RimI-like enzyme
VTDYIISRAASSEDLKVVARLFESYAATLPVDLAYQDFAQELAGLPGKYSSPTGALLLARDADGSALGCVALRGLSLPGCCEMKRLYLEPAARGRGLGRALTVAVIEEAKLLGYDELRLDTLASMTAAQALYRQLGFEVIAPYYEPTPAGTVFMALTLAR